MERKRASSSKSSKKHSSKQTAEGTLRVTRSKTGKGCRKIYTSSEDSSSDEMVNADWSQIENNRLYFRSFNSEDKLKEKIQDDSSDDSSLFVDVVGTSASESDLTARDKRLKRETSWPAMLPSSPELQEPGSSSPFRFWGQNAFRPIEPIKCSGSDVARKEDGTKGVDNANVGNTSKDINKDIRSKDWEKWRIKAAQKKQMEKMKEERRSKKDNADKPLDKGSHENLGSVTFFSPAIAERKGIAKRQSYPNDNTLKENRPRMST